MVGNKMEGKGYNMEGNGYNIIVIACRCTYVSLIPQHSLHH